MTLVNSKLGIVALTKTVFWDENWFWEVEPNMLELLVFTFEFTKTFFDGVEAERNRCIVWFN